VNRERKHLVEVGSGLKCGLGRMGKLLSFSAAIRGNSDQALWHHVSKST
jgi:hypothetical protein